MCTFQGSREYLSVKCLGYGNNSQAKEDRGKMEHATSGQNCPIIHCVFFFCPYVGLSDSENNIITKQRIVRCVGSKVLGDFYYTE